MTLLQTMTQAWKPYLISATMGSYLWCNGSYGVSIKHRMRKDSVAVMSVGIWRNSQAEYFVTTAWPSDEKAKEMAEKLLSWLVEGKLPTPALDLPTFPGYEEMDASVKLRKTGVASE